MDQRPGFKAYYLDASSSSIPSDWSEPHESMDEHHKFSVNLKKIRKKEGKTKNTNVTGTGTLLLNLNVLFCKYRRIEIGVKEGMVDWQWILKKRKLKNRRRKESAQPHTSRITCFVFSKS